MTEFLTAAQMRACEDTAIASGDVTGLALMERAGQGVVDAVFSQWPELAPAARAARGPAPEPPPYLGSKEGAVILCGPGNNGGDGFVVARLLAELGWRVDVFLLGDAEKLPPDARTNYDRWCQIGQVRPLTDDAIDGYAEDNPDVVLAVDAIFGIGLSGPFVTMGRVLDELNYWQASSPQGDTPKVVAIDIVSGICADSGRYLGMDGENPFDQCAMANLTVTFHRKKTGHVLAQGPQGSGQIVVCDIGLPSLPPQDCPDRVSQAQAPSWVLAKGVGYHKYSHGHVLVLAGPVGQGGAARLAARGALRVGAGVVTVGCPPAAMMENAAALNAVMLRSIADAATYRDMLNDKRINALCLGPGLGTASRETALVKAALLSQRALVLDADALTIVAANPALFGMLHPKCVLTPHAGEFARLFPDIAATLEAPANTGPTYSKVDAARAAANRAGCVVVLKGADSVIASPDHQTSVNCAFGDQAAPWLATAGSGDVLAGFIAGLLARGVAPQPAACTGVWLHGACARKFGPGLIAEDLPEQIPAVFRDLGIT